MHITSLLSLTFLALVVAGCLADCPVLANSRWWMVMAVMAQPAPPQPVGPWQQTHAFPWDLSYCLATAHDRLTAAEALTAGLISRVVSPEHLMEEAHSIAQKIAR